MQRLVLVMVLAIAACNSRSEDKQRLGLFGAKDTALVFMRDTVPMSPQDSARALGIARQMASKPMLSHVDYARRDSVQMAAWYASRPIFNPRRTAFSSARTVRGWRPVTTSTSTEWRCARIADAIAIRAYDDTSLYVRVIDNRARSYPNNYCVPWGVSVTTVDTADRILGSREGAPRACDPWPTSIPLEAACKRLARNR